MDHETRIRELEAQLRAKDARVAELEAQSAANAAPASKGEVRHLTDVERDAIEHALASVEGNRRKAADLLGIGERTLYDKIKRYGL